MTKFRHFALSVGLLWTCALSLTKPLRAEPFGYSLILQRETGVQRGFKLSLDDDSTVVPRPLEGLRISLAVADGKAWRSVRFQPSWQWDHDYRVKVILEPKGTRLWLDGRLVGESKGSFAGNNAQALKAGLESRNTGGTTSYLIRQSALRLSTNRGQLQDFTFPTPKPRSPQIFAFDPQTPLLAPWKTAQDETLTIETTFRLLHTPDIKSLSPAIDRYGQSIQAEWPEKIHNDEEFRQATVDETRRQTAWGVRAEIDPYGGTKNLGWTEKPTGFFRTVRRDGFWWLITPDGNPCFYLGVDTVTGISERTGVAGRESIFEELPPIQGEYAGAWDGSGDSKSFGFTAANLIRKYGDDWQNAAWHDAQKRLKTWGFSGIGKWSGITTPASPAQLPVQPVLRRTGVPTLGRLPDPFDPAVQAIFRTVLEKTIVPNKDNPYVIGWSVQNEHDEIVLKSDIQNVLQKPSSVPAKSALVDYALQQIYKGDGARMAKSWKIEAALGKTADAVRQNLENASPQPPPEDIETLRRYYADTYYGFIYRTVKEIDPNHLYFGFWIAPGWWENEEDWRLSARNCDVVGCDRYDYDFNAERMNRLMRESDKPVLIGEFSYPVTYNGSRGYGAFGTSLFGVWAASDAASGDAYTRWVGDAARNPYCIGMDWFQYRDQPITGRGTMGTRLVNGEHYASGLIDITDRPKWDMIERMRLANLNAAKVRSNASLPIK